MVCGHYNLHVSLLDLFKVEIGRELTAFVSPENLASDERPQDR